jgi:hypothetical protein
MGFRYPADPPKVEEIIAVTRAAGEGANDRRLRGLIVQLSVAHRAEEQPDQRRNVPCSTRRGGSSRDLSAHIRRTDDQSPVRLRGRVP